MCVDGLAGSFRKDVRQLRGHGRGDPDVHSVHDGVCLKQKGGGQQEAETEDDEYADKCPGHLPKVE
ncbi:hypothetical protein GCM10007918_38160 [Piscinibacter gummiphilus]|nr:hypothetical protein GCM10007918_38160 [Piscinibacter gummiphilus]